MHIKMVALDMDGTLLHDDHRLSPKNRATIQELSAHGVDIVLCTGRSPSSTLPYLDELGMDGIVITHNGAATVQSVGRKVLHSFEMTQEELSPYLAFCEQHDLHFDLNTTFDLFVTHYEALTPEMLGLYAQFRIEPKGFPGWDQLESPVVKMTISGEKERMDKIEEELAKWDHKLQCIRSGDYFIDVMHAEATKGNALKKLSEIRNVDQKNILAIGNYYNDLTMIQFAGIGIAMDNSPEDIKEAADDVTLSNNDDGVHAALVKYCKSII
ncbi:Cof-type HAD-IIB family hydrolase [Paenibacillus aquistagni]|uniref:Cof subfamily of IIB subfamily of haloacid dehalogenase superfamily/HAD-superfamily hydrolase, subfamily IIB n=1 Tax=Paenibacillus aquistagni TaxID=1852522 RepID=A0A1X7LI87_9BACL|nr:Cof-type HAD-IIB family hydrolase [Paenibacillus aquistagni]SMG53370.1 hypothetical protein SAMN06295960_3487 [Paenibacillus aquistagni]